ncbi:MAG: hypothetical protein NTX25_02260 [Proteobacteria bacterium]|nr:hypothetical protein [Pseudomonadota bacterium]
MKKITQGERQMATRMVLWLMGHGGEMDVDSLARLTGVPELEVKVWAVSERLLWDNGESLNISALPLAWAAFAGHSRTCGALNEAFKDLKMQSKKGSRFRKWVEECDCTLRSPASDSDPLRVA